MVVTFYSPYVYFEIENLKSPLQILNQKQCNIAIVALHLKPSINQYQVFDYKVLNHYNIVQLTLDYLQKPIHNQNTKM